MKKFLPTRVVVLAVLATGVSVAGGPAVGAAVADVHSGGVSRSDVGVTKAPFCGYKRDSMSAVHSWWGNCTDRGQKIVLDYIMGPDQYKCTRPGSNIIDSTGTVQNAWVDQSNPIC
ncbi:DUF6355 family natural product biosynthesis protein [Allokutzneria oryzae]|uniref:DUF6355 family natural product biosynthesis protein n=1 Tax=Allokutzneria oryzae TaxID=1378989 RepID=A0ABV6A0Q7_9PSEU